MKRLIVVTAALTLFGTGAAAQDGRVMNPSPLGVMQAVKGAPYAAEEITESLQVLADGTRISHQNQVTVYRDGEGRVRRESPIQITIWDPVARVSYSLDPKTMTATQSSLARNLYYFAAANTEGKLTVATTGLGANQTEAKADATQVQAQAMAEMAARLDKLKAELAASENTMIVNGNPASPQTVTVMKQQLDQAMEKVSQTGAAPQPRPSLSASKPSRD